MFFSLQMLIFDYFFRVLLLFCLQRNISVELKMPPNRVLTQKCWIYTCEWKSYLKKNSMCYLPNK